MSYVTEKAKELGEALQKDAAYTKLQEAQAIFDADTELQENIQKFNDMQAAFSEKRQQQGDDEALNKLAQELVEFRGQIMENPAMQQYNTAKQGFDSLIEEVNNILYFYMTGEEPHQGCSPEQCSGCSGCH